MTTAQAHPLAVATPRLAPASRYVVPPVPVRRFTVDEYHRMIDEGFFASDERCELLEGWIVAKMPRNPIHDAAIDIAMQLLVALLPAGWYVRCQSAMTTATSEPEPDLLVVRGVPRDYTARHPGPTEAAVVIEVANTTLADDRDLKGRVYARAGVQLYWIVNLIDRKVEVYTQPAVTDGVPAYTRRDDFGAGESVTFSAGPVAIGPIAVADLLP